MTDKTISSPLAVPHRLQLSRQRGWRLPANTVTVARPTRWGNPHRIGEIGWNPYYPDAAMTRVDAVNSFFFDLQGDGIWWDSNGTDRCVTVEEIRAELAGKNLACWCPLTDTEGNPVPCHADVLLEVANARYCRSCRCTGWDRTACIIHFGPPAWVPGESDICTSCATESGVS